MPEDTKVNPEPPSDPKPPQTEAEKNEEEQQMGDFITRHVLEKDSVFFEG